MEEYQVPARRLDAAERHQLDEQLEQARRRELEHAARRAQAERVEAERRALAQARRPWPERLLLARCGNCHAATVVQDAPRGKWRWRLTIERMRWLHGASVTGEEAALLADWLHRTQGALSSP